MSTQGSVVVTRESAIPEIDLQNYNVNMKRKNITGTKLSILLNEPSTTAYDIMKWEVQIVTCLQYYYTVRSRCPVHIDPLLIEVDSNKNIIERTVVKEVFLDRYQSDVMFIDVVTRVHSSIYQYIDSKNVNNPKNINTRILLVLGTYFFSSSASSCTKFDTSRICEYTSQLCDMVESGVLEALSLLVLKE